MENNVEIRGLLLHHPVSSPFAPLRLRRMTSIRNDFMQGVFGRFVDLHLPTKVEGWKLDGETNVTKHFRYQQMWVLYLYKAGNWGQVFPLHKLYPYSLFFGEDSSIFGT